MAEQEFKPYVPAETNLAELTFKAVFLGTVMAVVLGAANAYLGMKVGLTVAATFPAAVVAMAVLFNVLNAYINARWISHLGFYPSDWLTSLPFLVGVVLFGGGWLINQHADRTLIGLRKPGEAHYSIPRGGFYRYVSCPNYLGEIVEWIGWAILTWSLAGLAFAVFTIANLLKNRG